jgi:hypothetical protein
MFNWLRFMGLPVAVFVYKPSSVLRRAVAFILWGFAPMTPQPCMRGALGIRWCGYGAVLPTACRRTLLSAGPNAIQEVLYQAGLLEYVATCSVDQFAQLLETSGGGDRCSRYNLLFEHEICQVSLAIIALPA